MRRPVFHRQTETLAAAGRKQGAPCEIVELAGSHHFSIVTQLEDAGSALSRAALEQTGVG